MKVKPVTSQTRPGVQVGAPTPSRLIISGGYTTSMWVHRHRGELRRPVLMLHGIQSHPGWFIGSADALAAAGHPVFQLTRRGSGEHEADRGHADSPAQLLADVDSAVGYILDRFDTPTLHLLGVSWGGKYAACYALEPRRRKHLAGLTLVAPGIASQVDLAGWRKLRVALALLLRPRTRFTIPLQDPALFTDNAEMREYIEDDPFRLYKASAKFFWTSRAMDRMLQAAPEGTLALPVNLILAEGDRIIDNDATRAALRRMVGEKLNVTELPGAHTLEFEPDAKPLHEAILRGIEREP